MQQLERTSQHSPFTPFTFCRDVNGCQNKTVDHRKAFRHLRKCRYGALCHLIFQSDHSKKYQHLFRFPLCKQGFYCQSTSQEHINKLTHICQHGKDCKSIEDEDHLSKTVHISPKPHVKQPSAERKILYIWINGHTINLLSVHCATTE